MKKLLIAAAALAVTAAPIVASAAPFGFGHGGRGDVVRVHDNGFRGDRWNGGYRDGRFNDGRGAAVAAGLFGLFLGAAIASDHPHYVQDCGWETQAYPGPYGTVQYEQVQVCR
jgi:opacity protein-like surface antigen